MCEGTSTGHCPHNITGSAVHLVHDLLLCDTCSRVRFSLGYTAPNDTRPPQGLEILPQNVVNSSRVFTRSVIPSAPPLEDSISEEAVSSDITHADPGSGSRSSSSAVHNNPIVSEILCFITNKLDVMPLDMVTKLCDDFYSETDVSNAKTLLYEVCELNPEGSVSHDL